MMAVRQFDDADVEAVVRLLGEVAGLTAPLGERRSRLIEGLAQLVRADVWIWAGTRGFESNAPQPLYLHDGGYVGDTQRAAVFHHSAQAGFWEAVNLQLDRTDRSHRTIMFD